MSNDYRDGFDDGVKWAMRTVGSEIGEYVGPTPGFRIQSPMLNRVNIGGKKPKRRKSKKVKILDEMAKKAWNKYKKGSGKKTYIQIRAQVSRSQAYKKKVKNL